MPQYKAVFNKKGQMLLFPPEADPAWVAQMLKAKQFIQTQSLLIKLKKTYEVGAQPQLFNAKEAASQFGLAAPKVSFASSQAKTLANDSSVLSIVMTNLGMIYEEDKRLYVNKDQSIVSNPEVTHCAKPDDAQCIAKALEIFVAQELAKKRPALSGSAILEIIERPTSWETHGIVINLEFGSAISQAKREELTRAVNKRLTDLGTSIKAQPYQVFRSVEVSEDTEARLMQDTSQSYSLCAVERLRPPGTQIVWACDPGTKKSDLDIAKRAIRRNLLEHWSEGEIPMLIVYGDHYAYHYYRPDGGVLIANSVKRQPQANKVKEHVYYQDIDDAAVEIFNETRALNAVLTEKTGKSWDQLIGMIKEPGMDNIDSLEAIYTTLALIDAPDFDSPFISVDQLRHEIDTKKAVLAKTEIIYTKSHQKTTTACGPISLHVAHKIATLEADSGNLTTIEDLAIVADQAITEAVEKDQALRQVHAELFTEQGCNVTGVATEDYIDRFSPKSPRIS